MNPFVKRFFLLVGGLVLFCFFVMVLTSIAKYKPYGVPDLRRAEWDALQAEIAERNRLLGLQQESSTGVASNASSARAMIEVREHDFGLLDPGGSAQHTFVISNSGTSDLVLKAGDTSCKCTLSEVSRQVVRPGESAEITLIWNTGQAKEFYRQYALVETNDPENREIELAVTGTIRTLLDFKQESVAVPSVEPGMGVEATTVIFSQVLPDFEILRATCDLPGFAYSLEPLGEEELSSMNATSGYKFRITSSAALERGEFHYILRVEVRDSNAPDGVAGIVRELPVHGKALGPISFYGDGLDSRAGLDMGVVADGKERVFKLLVKTRGASLPDELVVSKVEPGIIQAGIERLESRPDTFRLVLKIPEGAPQTIFNRPEQHGLVEVADPDNPTFSSWFPIYGAVMKIE